MIEVIESISDGSGPITSYEGVVNRSLEAFSGGPECHMILTFLTDRDVLTSDLAYLLEQKSVSDKQVRLILIEQHVFHFFKQIVISLLKV